MGGFSLSPSSLQIRTIFSWGQGIVRILTTGGDVWEQPVQIITAKRIVSISFMQLYLRLKMINFLPE